MFNQILRRLKAIGKNNIKMASSAHTKINPIQDENIGKLFTNYMDDKQYLYVTTATTHDKSSTLYVVFQDIKTSRNYMTPWNEFFGSTGKQDARIPKFKEVITPSEHER